MSRLHLIFPLCTALILTASIMIFSAVTQAGDDKDDPNISNFNTIIYKHLDPKNRNPQQGPSFQAPRPPSRPISSGPSPSLTQSRPADEILGTLQTKKQEYEMQYKSYQNAVKNLEGDDFARRAHAEAIAADMEAQWQHAQDMLTMLQEQIAKIVIEIEHVEHQRNVDGSLAFSKADDVQLAFQEGRISPAVEELERIQADPNRSPEGAQLVRHYLDDQGVLKLPENVHGGLGDYRLQSDSNTLAGKMIRQGVNAVQSAVASVALNGAQAQPIRDLAELTLGGVILSDRFVAMDNPLGMKLMDDLSLSISFLKGVAGGAANFITSSAELAYEITFHTQTVIGSVANALRDWEKTGAAIKMFAVNKWQEFLAADDNKKAEMMGSLTFEVGSLFVPAGAVAKGIGSSVKAALTVAAEGARVAVAAERIGMGLGKLEVGLARAAKMPLMRLGAAYPNALIRLSESSPEFVRDLLRYSKSLGMNTEESVRVAHLALEKGTLNNLSRETAETLLKDIRSRPFGVEDLLQENIAVLKTDLRAQERLLIASQRTAENQRKIVAEIVSEKFPNAEFKSIPKRTNLEEFVEGVVEKNERPKLRFEKMDDMHDMSRGRVNLNTKEDVENFFGALKEKYGSERILNTSTPNEIYPRYHADVRDLETGLAHEWQIGTKATTQFLETPSIKLPENVKLNGKAYGDFHDLWYDRVRHMKDPIIREKFGIDKFETKYNQLFRETAEGVPAGFEKRYQNLSDEFTEIIGAIEKDAPGTIKALSKK